MKSKELLTRILKSVQRVANELQIPPVDLTKAQFLKETELEITDWQLRRLGGYTGIVKANFVDDTDLSAKAASTVIRQHKNRLDRLYGLDFYIKEEFILELQEILKSSPIKVHKPLKTKKSKASKISRTIVANISDTHFGCNIEKQEMGNLNEFNWEVAARRLGLLTKQIADYKPEHRKDTELVVLLNGDMIAGVIHNQEWAVDLLTEQFAGALKLLSQSLSYLATKFQSVKVKCSPGNHGRAMHKSSKQRATVHKWDSYENMLYLALQESLKTHKNVEFDIPLTPYVKFKIYEHNYFMTHGDTVVNVGMPGRSINMNNIKNQLNDIMLADLDNLSENKVDVLVAGHVHTPTTQLLSSGAIVMINGCLSGLDQYANGGVGIWGNHPSQQIWEVTPEHAVGDMRCILLKGADDDKSLEQIVEPYTRIL